jgi:transposase-like protein
METHARASDGRRRFTAEFKREQMSRVSRGEVTLAELSREIDVSPSVVRRWKYLVERGSHAAVAANEEVVPVSLLREAQQRITELERALPRFAALMATIGWNRAAYTLDRGTRYTAQIIVNG